jgi:superfamily II DNA or RNA helicase
MSDLRKRNNASSKKSYEKSLEQQYANHYEHEMVHQHILTNPGTDAFHWSIVPEEWLYNAGYITDFNKHRHERLMNKKEKKEDKNRVKDYGFDGLARACVGSSIVYNGLQAKYYLERQVCASDIGSFLAMQLALIVKNPLSKGYLYTTSKLQVDLAGNIANPSYPIRHVLHPWKHPDARSAPTVPPVQQECDKLLRADQIDALKQLEDKEGINALNTPCRWGKTIVAGHHTKQINAKLVVAIAPLLISVENLQERLACFLPGYSALLVDSDTGGVTNVEDIKKFLAYEGNHIIYSTFKSAVDILSDLLTEYEDKYILGDEIHNANAQVCEFIQQFSKGLVMSATMPVEICEVLEINHTVYIPFAQAIKDEIVVDYSLWLPHLTKASDGATSVDVEIPVEFSTYDSDLTAKAFYLATVMLKTGSRRCITYLCRQEECDRFIEVVTQIFEIYHGLTIWTGKIDSTISKAKRKELLEAFQTGQDDIYHILTSVRILDEAVDIPRCDSVFITNVGEHSSDIRMMQRSQRGSTKDPKNPSKHNNIILWADGWEKCVGALDLLREADPEFHKKVRIADCNYDKSGEVARIESMKAQELNFTKWDAMQCVSVWELNRLHWIAQYEKLGKTPIAMSKDVEEKRAGAWQQNQRTYFKNNSKWMTEERIRILTETDGWKWEAEDCWEPGRLHWSAMYKKLGRTPSHGSKDPENKKAGIWQNSQRAAFRNKSSWMTEERIRILTDTDGWKWEEGDPWEKHRLHWIAMHKTLGRTPSHGSKDPEVKKAGKWQQHQRTNRRTNAPSMTEEKISILTDTYGWKWEEEDTWEPCRIHWITMCQTLGKNPSDHSKNKEEQRAASWQNTQRMNKKKNATCMTAERIAALNATPGWAWSADAPTLTIEH